ncbi:tumor necrosis factor alpha-induced protein 2-like [Sebastes fasciatus]|uniref:tumor necrosis factor alpha-induced protein 2-like n=1 Tax=Sebastes fasciatus TaxID=394691 RepID=UPI003D9EEEAB
MQSALAGTVSPTKPQLKNTIWMKSFKLEMKKITKLAVKTKGWRSNSRKPLIEENNNGTQDGHDQAGTGYDNPSTHNNLNTDKEQRLQGEQQSEQQSEDQITPQEQERYEYEHFPKLPADVEQNLYPHLLKVQETVHNRLVRLGPLLQSTELIERYHRQTFDHLDDLLQNVSSPQNSLMLMKWVLHTYLSQELLGSPLFQKMDPIKKVDLLLLTEWTTRAEDKLIQNVQKEVRRYMENILQYEKSKEAHNELYVDTIQCIAAMPEEAHKISTKLSHHVQEVCFQELLVFLGSYSAKQTEILEKEAEMVKPEMKHFFTTLNNCKELKQHVQTKTNDITTSLLNETVKTLENLEAFTLKLLMEIVADIAERHLKKYFKSENNEFYLLIDAVQCHFSELSGFPDIQKGVMDDTYKLIAHIYLKHLIEISLKKLKRNWSHDDVGQKVAKDAELLHDTISDLAPDVRQCNLMLLKVKELLDCKCPEATKMTVAGMQQECYTYSLSEDLELLPALLRWKGLPRRQIRDVQSVLEDVPGYQVKTRSASWCCCISGED